MTKIEMGATSYKMHHTEHGNKQSLTLKMSGSENSDIGA